MSNFWKIITWNSKYDTEMHNIDTTWIEHMYNILNEVCVHPSSPIEITTHKFELSVFVAMEKG